MTTDLRSNTHGCELITIFDNQCFNPFEINSVLLDNLRNPDNLSDPNSVND